MSTRSSVASRLTLRTREEKFCCADAEKKMEEREERAILEVLVAVHALGGHATTADIAKWMRRQRLPASSERAVVRACEAAWCANVLARIQVSPGHDEWVTRTTRSGSGSSGSKAHGEASSDKEFLSGMVQRVLDGGAPGAPRKERRLVVSPKAALIDKLANDAKFVTTVMLEQRRIREGLLAAFSEVESEDEGEEEEEEGESESESEGESESEEAESESEEEEGEGEEEEDDREDESATIATTATKATTASKATSASKTTAPLAFRDKDYTDYTSRDWDALLLDDLVRASKDKGSAGSGSGSGSRAKLKTLVLVAADHSADALDHFADARAYEIVSVAVGGARMPKNSGDAALLWNLFRRLARGELAGRSIVVASRSRPTRSAVEIMSTLEGVPPQDAPARVRLHPATM